MAELTLTPGSFDFGTVPLDSGEYTTTFQMTNTATEPLYYSINENCGMTFGVSPCCTGVLAQGASVTETVLLRTSSQYSSEQAYVCPILIGPDPAYGQTWETQTFTVTVTIGTSETPSSVDDSKTFTIIVGTTGNLYYVSTTGNDGWNGQYPDYQSGINGPFKTLAHAITHAVSGDTIYMRGGTYISPITITKSGLTISNWNGEQVILNGSTSGNFMLQFSSGVSNVKFYGLNFENCTDACGFISVGNDHIEFSHCGFYDIPRYVLQAFNETGAPENYINFFNMNNCIMDNVGHEPDWNGEVVSLGGCKDFTYEYNEMTNFTKQGLHNGAGSCYGMIQGNTFDNFDYFCYKIDPAYGDEKTTHHIIVRNNLFTGTGPAQIIFNAENNGGPCYIHDIDIYNNVFNGAARCFATFANAPNSTYQNIRIMYNTFYVTGSTYAMTIANDNNAQYSGCVIANNILVNSLQYQISNEATTGWTYQSNHFYRPGSTAGGIAGVGLGTGGSQGDPKFVNIGTNFHLTSLSTQCINTASSTYTVTDDFEGTPRPQPPGGGYDRGAYEYH